ncbi:cyclophilin-like fold protein [Achromobacter mucicolens]|uniref:cyclophilin-like fold protein n=1 Tax=Achromobacter mucicolens TaxID=1389922 RepID=UPI0021DB27ED|nr:cyclophilin-like fold protein [Achromobacter mucicolens]
MEDYDTIERVATLPAKLSADGAPQGMAPVAGELTHYAPWGNLAIFVKGRPMRGACCRWARSMTAWRCLPGQAPTHCASNASCPDGQVRAAGPRTPTPAATPGFTGP